MIGPACRALRPRRRCAEGDCGSGGVQQRATRDRMVTSHLFLSICIHAVICLARPPAKSSLRHHTPAAWSSVSGALRNAQSKNDGFLGGGNKPCRP
jgi:hypothetical protein